MTDPPNIPLSTGVEALGLDRPCLVIVCPLEGDVIVGSNVLVDGPDAARLRAWIESRPALGALFTAGIAAAEGRPFSDVVQELVRGEDA